MFEIKNHLSNESDSSCHRGHPICDKHLLHDKTNRPDKIVPLMNLLLYSNSAIFGYGYTIFIYTQLENKCHALFLPPFC